MIVPFDLLAVFSDIFTNLIVDVMFGIFLLTGIIIGVLLRPRQGNIVLHLNSDEHRYQELNIETETAVSVECKPRKGSIQKRFFKYAPGFTGMAGRLVKRMRTLYLGKEGTAYTWCMEQEKKIESTLENTLRTMWGSKFYDLIPDEERDLVEKSKVGVTISLETGLTPEGFKQITEDNIKAEEDRQAAKTYWQGKKQELRGETIKMIMYLMAGAGIMAIASKVLGWW